MTTPVTATPAPTTAMPTPVAAMTVLPSATATPPILIGLARAIVKPPIVMTPDPALVVADPAVGCVTSASATATWPAHWIPIQVACAPLAIPLPTALIASPRLCSPNPLCFFGRGGAGGPVGRSKSARDVRCGAGGRHQHWCRTNNAAAVAGAFVDESRVRVVADVGAGEV